VARFNDIHGRQLQHASNLKPGDHWRVAVREPIFLVFLETDPEKIQSMRLEIVDFVIQLDGSIRPATYRDEFIIASWNFRHRLTPKEHFDFRFTE
jgi:hypothetical protein